MSDRTHLSDLDPDAQIFVTTNRTSSTKRVHTDRTCRHLRAADCPVVEKRPPMYPDSKPVCLSCTGSPPKGPNDRSIYEAACAAGEADE
jgi:hypothetical protein